MVSGRNVSKTNCPSYMSVGKPNVSWSICQLIYLSFKYEDNPHPGRQYPFPYESVVIRLCFCSSTLYPHLIFLWLAFFSPSQLLISSLNVLVFMPLSKAWCKGGAISWVLKQIQKHCLWWYLHLMTFSPLISLPCPWPFVYLLPVLTPTHNLSLNFISICCLPVSMLIPSCFLWKHFPV